MAIIFEDERLQVLHVPGASRYAVACFGTLDDRANGHRFWGRALAERHGVECFGFASKGPDWYPAPSVAAAAAAIAGRLGKPLIGYGHSMGGYACLKHARRLGLIGAVASAPQLSIDPAESLGDLRYARHFRPELHLGMGIRAEDLTGRLVLAYDPLYADDRQQAEAIFALSPAVQPLALPHMLHRTVFALRPREVLLPLFGAILTGQTLPPLAVAARRARKPHPQYRIYLARALLRSAKPRAAVGVLETLPAELSPDLARERSLYLARGYARTGAVPRAVALMRALVEERPDHPTYRMEWERMSRLRRVA